MLDVDSFTSFDKKDNEIKCEKCAMTYSQFAKGGRLGCDNCYALYGSKLEYLFKRIHGNVRHTGKIPKRSGKVIRFRQELNAAKIELQKAVLNEEFELAAKLRDEIKELEKEKSSEGGVCE